MTPEHAAAEMGCEVSVTVRADGRAVATAHGVRASSGLDAASALHGLIANKKASDHEKGLRLAAERLAYGIREADFDPTERQALFDEASKALLALGRLAGVRTW